MILISAALVLAAIVLLIAGVVLGTPPLVMWSIVVSVLSAVCLLIGALLRRHELFPAGGRAAEGTAPTPQGSSVPQLAHVGAVSGTYGGTLAGAPAQPVATPMVAAPPVTHHGALPPQTIPSPPPQRTGPITRPAAGSGRGLAPDAIVLVIPGRKRFHLATCRQLAGRDTEELTHEEAREEGFTPCTTCLPDISARTAGPEGAARNDDTTRDDAVRDGSPRAQAAPTTTTPPAGTSGTNDQEQPRPTPADREPPSARPSQPGVPGPRLPEESAPASSGTKPSQPSTPEPSAPESSGGKQAASGSSTDGRTTGAKPSDDHTREKHRETPSKASGAAGDPDAPERPADDTAAEARTTRDGLTPVDWFGRGASRPKGAAAEASGPAAPTPPSTSATTSSRPSSGSSAPSSSAPAWSSPAAGSASGAGDDETDESLTDTAEHIWFRPTRAARPWDPARSRPAAQTAKGTAASEGGQTDPVAAGKKSPAASAARQNVSPSRAGDDRARDDRSDSDAGGKPARPADASASPHAGATKPVEPAETSGSGRAGSAASAGSTSASRAGAPGPARGKDGAQSDGAAEASAGKPAVSGKVGTDKTGTGKTGTGKTGTGKTGTGKTGTGKTGTGKAGAGKTGTDKIDTGKTGAAEGGAAESGESSEDRGGAGRKSGEDRTANTEKPSAGKDAEVRVMIGTRRYHTAGCPLLGGLGDSDIETMTRSAADEAGLTPCSVCQND